jgi:hypothetical protein
MYKPKVDDYVIWNTNPQPLEGWVYFVSDYYITIEIGVKCMDENTKHCSLHEKTHTLVLCFPEEWKNLEYIKTRVSKYSDECYSQIPERY